MFALQSVFVLVREDLPIVAALTRSTASASRSSPSRSLGWLGASRVRLSRPRERAGLRGHRAGPGDRAAGGLMMATARDL
jgi:hypothetical protein